MPSIGCYVYHKIVAAAGGKWGPLSCLSAAAVTVVERELQKSSRCHYTYATARNHYPAWTKMASDEDLNFFQAQ